MNPNVEALSKHVRVLLYLLQRHGRLEGLADGGMGRLEEDLIKFLFAVREQAKDAMKDAAVGTIKRCLFEEVKRAVDQASEN